MRNWTNESWKCRIDGELWCIDKGREICNLSQNFPASGFMCNSKLSNIGHYQSLTMTLNYHELLLRNNSNSFADNDVSSTFWFSIYCCIYFKFGGDDFRSSIWVMQRGIDFRDKRFITSLLNIYLKSKIWPIKIFSSNFVIPFSSTFISQKIALGRFELSF